MNYSLLTLAAVAAFSASVAATPAHAAQPSELIVDGGFRCTNKFTWSTLDIKVYRDGDLVHHSSSLTPSQNETALQACERTIIDVCNYLKTFNPWAATPIRLTYGIELFGPSVRRKGVHVCD